MPAYDFKEAFVDEKKNEGVFVAPGESISQELIENLNAHDKSDIFGNNQTKTISTAFSEIDVTPHRQENSEQLELRTKLVKEFLAYIQPYVDKNIFFKMSRNEFKLSMLIPATFFLLLSLLAGGGILIASTLLFPLFIYLQVSDKAQMNIFENKIWTSINNIPEDKLKAVLHSILSNKLNTDYIYSEDEIKEIIYNYMYNQDKDSQTLAKLEIKERLRFLLGQQKKIIYQNN